MKDSFIRVNEVMDILQCKSTRAYAIIRNLNKELKEQGYYTMAGRAPRSYFEKRMGLSNQIK